jgi:hypothetical protein
LDGSDHDLVSLFEHDLAAQTLRVCREGKPVFTFPDHAPAAFFQRARLNAGADRESSRKILKDALSIATKSLKVRIGCIFDSVFLCVNRL